MLAHIRGKNVLEARALLLYSKRAVAKDIELVLRSAVANAEANHGLSPDELVVHEAFADDGVTIKRWRPRARGRANRIEKRTTHITLLLRPVEGLELAGRARARAGARGRGEAEAPAQLEGRGRRGRGRGRRPPPRPPTPRPRPPRSRARGRRGRGAGGRRGEPEAEAVVVDDEVEAAEDVAEDDDAAAESEPAREQDDDDEPSAQADGKE